MHPHDPGQPGDDDLFCLLYVSDMASPDGAEVARICASSRDNNVRDAITGLLVFDGKAFCQYVEGPAGAVTALRDRLERDPRHVRMRVLQFGPSGPSRRFPSWRLGYAFAADPAAIERIEASRGSRAVDAFHRWLRSLGLPEPADR